VVESKATGYDVIGDPRPAVTAYVALHQLNDGTFPSLAALMRDIAKQVMEYGTLSKIPAATVGNTRNEMYLVSEAIRFLMKDKESDLSTDDIATLNKYKGSLCSGNFRYVCVDVARFFLPVGKVGLGLGVKR
jgi:inorganic phosphate transporter, PiT family